MTDDLVPMGEAAKRVGISMATLRRRAAAGEFPIYASSFNRKEKLIRLEDLIRYGKPRPLTQPSSSDERDPERIAG